METGKKKTLKQLEKTHKIFLYTLAFISAALVVIFGIAAVKTSIRISQAADVSSMAEKGGLSKISLPDLPAPIATEDGVDTFDLFEYTLWEAETEYIEAYNYYESVFFEASELADITDPEYRAEKFDRLHVNDYRESVLEGLSEARAAAGRLRNIALDGGELDRNDLIQHVTFLSFLHEATDFTDTHAAYGSQACADAVRSLKTTMSHIFVAIGLVILMLAAAFISSILTSKMVAAARTRRSRPQITYAPVGAPEEDEEGNPVAESNDAN